MKKYFAFHCHTTYSKMDSTAQPEDYIAKLKEMGHTSVCFTEHGNISNFMKKKQLADKAGLKFVHGVEAYLTSAILDGEGKKIRENFHVILLAKNQVGVEEINELVTLSSDAEHFYYRPRLTFDEYFNISNNVIKISACMGGVLNKIERTNPYFDKFVESFDFLEIHAHMCEEQITYNEMLITLGKPLIVGTDSHELTEYGQECRAILMKSKGLDDDEGKFDLVLRSYDEVVEQFKRQSSLPESLVLEALENTNVLEDMIEPFELDYTFKYPTDYEDEESLIIQKSYDAIINGGFPDSYYSRVDEEIESFKKVGMCGFMLYMSEIAEFCINNNYPYGPGRGSCTGSLVAYLLKITDVDPMIWGTNFSRFVNDSRISLGDIDVDFAPEDRINIYNYIRNRSTDNKSCYIGTFGKLSTKSIVDNVSRVLCKPLDEVARIKDGYATIEKEESMLKRVYENGGISESDFESKIEDIQKQMKEYLSKFEDIFYYYDGLNGVIVSEGKHACGMIGSPVSVRSNIGLRFDSKSDSWVSQCDMKNVDSVNFVKFDVLSLKTLQVIKHTYQLLGKEIPRASEIDWNDKAVYDSMTLSPVGLFQMESDSTFSHMAKFAPTNLKEIALINAVVRPSCDSFRNEVIERKFHSNASPHIDEVLHDTFGRLVYQEQIISFLQEVCGFTGQDADNVRRCIGKKDIATLMTWIPKIEAGYIAKSDKDETTAKEECAEFLQVMKDAGSYSFSYNHSLAYSMITYQTAYLRHYHPLEFTTAYLNNATDESDIQSGTQLAQTLDISIENPTYGKSSAKYAINGKSIYKGMESILYVSEKCSQTLSEVAQHTLGFHEVVSQALSFPSVNTRQIEVLIKVEFFKEFGCACKLHEWFLRYKEYSGRKSFKKEGIPRGTEMIIKRMIENNVEGFGETAKQYKVDSKVILDEIFRLMKNVDFEPTQKIVNELSYLGYIQTQELKSVKVGTVNTNKTKLGAFKIDFIDGSGAWYKFEEDKEPTKGMMISVITESQRKEGRYTQKYIDMWEEIVLDRQTRK
ncbi:MAG: PHP domain-containing protein [Cetobacterium sp.]